MSMTELLGEEPSFQVELTRKDDDVTKTKRLKISSQPLTFLDIKKAIEKSFSIPACVQTLLYQSCLVKDSDSLLSHYVRSGDTLQVAYPSEGNCERVIEVVKWLKRLADAIGRIKMPSVHMCTFNQSDDGYLDYARVLESPEFIEVCRDLSVNLMYPWTDNTKYVNKVHFEHLGAVRLVMSVYFFMTLARRNKISLFGRHLLENVCSLFVANFTQTFSLRRSVIQAGGLDLCINTFITEDLDDFYDAIEVALTAICNLSELPECQLKLAQRTEITDQVLRVAMSHLFDCKTAIVSASYLLCLAMCPATHKHLLQPKLVGRLLEVCAMRKEICENQDIRDAPMALESYVCVVLAQMILGSSQHLLTFSEQALKKIEYLMEHVCKCNPVEIRAYEIKEGLVWGTFIPFMVYLYEPEVQNTTGPEVDINVVHVIQKLQTLSIKVLIHALHNALGRETHVKILLEEGLLDYAMALLWYVPESCTGMVRNMLKDIGKLTQIKPPSLCSLTKAKFAKEVVGLRKVLNMRSVSDLFL